MGHVLIAPNCGTQAEAARRIMEKARLTANKRPRGTSGKDPRLPSDPTLHHAPYTLNPNPSTLEF